MHDPKTRPGLAPDLSRKEFLRGGVALGIGLPTLAALAACDSDEGEPVRRSNVVVAVSADPPGLDPHLTFVFGFEFAMNVYSTLLTHDVDTQKGTYLPGPDNLVPEVAESWEIAADNRSVTFALNPNAAFSDGSPVTAEDVHYSFERGIDGKLGFTASQYELGGMLSTDQLEVVDEKTFRVRFPDGLNRFSMTNFATESFVILSKKVTEANSTKEDPWGSKHLGEEPLGTGPYVLDSFSPGERIVLKARPDYWGAPKPAYKTIEYRIVPDAETRALLLRSGDVDVAYQLDYRKYRDLASVPNLKVVSVTAAQDILALRMNPGTAPFDDINIRKAVIKAIPYDRIVEETVHGYGTKVGGPCGVNSVGYEEYPLYTTDMDEARALVGQSKYSGDVPAFEIPLPTSNPERIAAAVFIQSSLREIGIPMEIRKMPLSAYTDLTFKKNMSANLHLMDPWANDCLYWAWYMFNSESPSNYVNYSNPEVDRATNEALQLSPDAESRYAELVDQVVGDHLVEEAVVAPLYQANWTVAASKDVSQIVYWPWQCIEWKYARPA